MNIPTPNKDSESFEDYYKRWKHTVESDMPKVIVKTWVFENFDIFRNNWIDFGSLKWNYKEYFFLNDEILLIGYNGGWLETLDGWGRLLFSDPTHKDSSLGKYMLENGTTPEPILIFKHGGNLDHPRSNGYFKFAEPYQLIEGHMRTAYLRGMINNRHSLLKERHKLWVATLKT